MRITHYAILGILVGVGAAVLQTCTRPTAAPTATAADDDVSPQYRDLIDKGFITVTKVPHGWRPGEPLQ